ncbi:hypothetical protein [Salinarimonas rosea]|uniref:hypothetical protein n=1 Tax=Salinarimonas rosea TaxID=552063 RepID=UPI001FDA9308|nr:hypothetical protein [Salinarimonas rosea]
MPERGALRERCRQILIAASDLHDEASPAGLAQQEVGILLAAQALRSPVDAEVASRQGLGQVAIDPVRGCE